MIEKRRNFVFRFLPGLFLSGLLLLSGCSQDDVSDVPAGSRAIDFRAQGGMSALKATTTGAEYIRSFAVNAHYGAYGDQGKFLMEGVTVYRGEGGGSSWTYSPQAYFPTTNEGDIDFFAYSPSGSKYVERSLKDAAVANDADQKIIYVVPAPNGSATSQEDLLVARQTVGYNDEKGAYPGTAVGLQFHHALSRILVAASSSLGKEVPVTITKLELKNLYSKGDLSLKDVPLSEGWGYTNGVAGANVLWTNDGSTLASYEYSLPKSGVYVGETSATVTGDDQGIFVLPQTTKGNPGDGSPEAGVTDDGEFGLKVSYSINGSPDRDAYIQFCDITDPVVATEGVTFEIGRQYVLNLTFGAGSGSVDDPDPDINIGARISFEDLDVDPYPDNIQAPAPPRFKPAPAIWSQSNIYYDNTLDGNPNDEVGALTFSEEEDGKNLYQGVSFKWGSLIGVSSYNGYLSSGHLFIPDSNGKYYKVAILDLENWADDGGVVATFKNTYFGSIVWSDLSKYDDDGNNARIALWNAIPYTDLANISSYVTASPPGRTARDNNGLTEASGTAALPYTTYKGDICKYLVDKKTANGNANTLTDGLKWRLPTSNEFGLLVAGSHANDDDTRDFVIGDYITRWKSDDSNGGTVNTGSNPENGKNEMSSGGYSFYTLDYVVDGTAKPSFPASGTRFNFAYMFETSYNGGNYWSSSVYTEWSAYGLGFTSSYVNPGTYGLKGIGCNVRCVHSY